MSHLRDAFLQALSAHGKTQSKFAEEAGVSRSNITYFLAGGAPRDDLFRALFAIWNNNDTALHLFRAHIHDEAERAGLDPEKINVASASTSELLAIEEDLHSLRKLLISDPEVRPFIRRMASDFKAASGNPIPYPEKHDTTIGHVAEDPPAKPVKKPPVSKK